jgi:hypothetical protein
MLSVDEAPAQTVAGETEAEDGAVDSGLTVTVVLTQAVELQVLSALK